MKTLQLLFLICTIQLSAQASWQMAPNAYSNPNGQRFDDVFFLNENLGWAANGYYAAVYKTTDGGLSWTEQLNESELPGGYYFRNIEFLDANIGFLGTLNGSFFKTVDGGSSWTEVSISPNPNAICGLDAVGTSTIYGCGAYFSPAHIIKSTDSGDTWTLTDMSAYANALVEVLFLDEMHGFASGKNFDGGLILETTDGGSTWTEIYNTNSPGDYVWKLQTLPGNNDIMFGSVSSVTPNLGQLIKSTNGGQTWTSYDAPETDIQAVGFISETQGWMGGHTTGFYETLDGGQTWTNLNIGNNLNRIVILSPSLAYASGTTVYKFTEDTLSNQNIEIDDSEDKLDITLSRNPIKDVLEFTIDFPSDDNLVIELYDVNGKYIKQLSRDIILHHTLKSYSFDLSEMESGVYFVNFHNNSGRSSIKIVKR
ncbi:YCF48-related protein [Psychroserpens sp. XS_ASV72]|uniref:YCF48-related protein n=1 Tax=Psychroserpens sp. XS_ASV72 TaxID=3241293 RepID=UPI00351567A0